VQQPGDPRRHSTGIIGALPEGVGDLLPEQHSFYAYTNETQRVPAFLKGSIMCQEIDGPNTATDPDSDSASVETLVQRSLPSVERWAHGRLPRAARGQFDTRDLVQEAALRMLTRGRRFAPRHAKAVNAYLRMTVLNLIRDEARRIARRPESVELNEEPPCERTGPLRFTLRQELRARYEQALHELRPKDRELVVARVEDERNVKDIASAFGLSPAAGRMAINRAINRLMQKLNRLK
jgi:RNA polymerase sigma-70 factor (ECF subfamily)